MLITISSNYLYISLLIYAILGAKTNKQQGNNDMTTTYNIATDSSLTVDKLVSLALTKAQFVMAQAEAVKAFGLQTPSLERDYSDCFNRATELRELAYQLQDEFPLSHGIRREEQLRSYADALPIEAMPEVNEYWVKMFAVFISLKVVTFR